MSIINVDPSCPNVQDLISQSVEGDTIKFAEGIYQECGWKVSKRLRFEGHGQNTVFVGRDNLSGDGGVPRAILELDDKANGSEVLGLTFMRGQNKKVNAAGLRLIGTQDVRVDQCTFDECDNGLFASGIIVNLLVFGCLFRMNGRGETSHNAYLAEGMNATFDECIFDGTVNGQSLKSRVSHLTVIGCRFKRQKNRALDLVNSHYTSDNCTVIVDSCNIITRWVEEQDFGKQWIYKKNDTLRPGNRHVIQFGDDTDRQPSMSRGKLIILNSTIVTPFPESIIQLTGGNGTKAWLIDNRFFRPEGVVGQGSTQNVTDTMSRTFGGGNMMSSSFAERYILSDHYSKELED